MAIRSVWDRLSVSVIGLYAISLFLLLWTYDLSHAKALLGLYVTKTLSEALKHVCKGHTCPRPDGAMDCNTFCTNGDQSGQPGMPSTHAAFVMFFFAYYAPVLIAPLRILMALYAVAVIYARYAKKCHSAIQLISGGALGSAMAFLFRL